MRRVLYIVVLFMVAVLGGYKLWADTHKPDTSHFGVEAAETNTISVDFGKQIATGSPLIFGGAHAPYISNQDAWDLLVNVGVTMIRRDFFIESELPQNITLEAYKNNVNNVQNPDNWNWPAINNTLDIYRNAQDRGMKVMGILSYAPKWLTYSGTDHGVPKDWDVYRDIVKKLYTIHRPFLDYIEIWNEPDFNTFLNINNSNLSRDAAYNLIFDNAVRAIKEVDAEMNDGKHVQIGGPTISYTTGGAFADAVLKSSSVKNSINFFSYHNYGQPEPSWNSYKPVLQKNNLAKLPIFITEWNDSSDDKFASPYVTTDLAIPYTAGKLIDFLNMGIGGANYFSTTYNDQSKPNTVFGSFGIYRQKNGKSYLLPQGKTWRLLSKSMGLGAGASKVVNAFSNSDLNSAGFINSHNQRGVAAVNSTNNLELVQVNAANVNIFGKATVKIFEASADEDGGTATCTNEVNVSNRTMSFKILVPPQSVVGLLITPPELSLARFMRVLGANTSSNCIAQ